MSTRMLIFPTREDWLKGRGHTIGGSDASAIVGMNPYKTNEQLWLEKTGQAVPEDISDKTYVKYGQEAEHLVQSVSCNIHISADVFLSFVEICSVLFLSDNQTYRTYSRFCRIW